MKQMTETDGIEVEREKRGEVTYWVHLRGSGPFNEVAMNRRLNQEATAWAREEGMTRSDYLSSGGEYGHSWRHSRCYRFHSA